MDQTKPTSGQPAVPVSARAKPRLFRWQAPDWLRGLLRNRKSTIGIIILVFFRAREHFRQPARSHTKRCADRRPRQQSP